MRKNIGKICYSSYSYRKVTHNHTTQKQLPILRLIDKVMAKNIGQVNQVSPPRLSRNQV